MKVLKPEISIPKIKSAPINCITKVASVIIAKSGISLPEYHSNPASNALAMMPPYRPCSTPATTNGLRMKDFVAPTKRMLLMTIRLE